MKTCPRCNEENDDGDKFCYSCGYAFDLSKPNVDNSNKGSSIDFGDSFDNAENKDFSSKKINKDKPYKGKKPRGNSNSSKWNKSNKYKGKKPRGNSNRYKGKKSKGNNFKSNKTKDTNFKVKDQYGFFEDKDFSFNNDAAKRKRSKKRSHNLGEDIVRILLKKKVNEGYDYSKTKILSILLFIILMIAYPILAPNEVLFHRTYDEYAFLISFIASLIIVIPAYLIGLGIRWLVK